MITMRNLPVLTVIGGVLTLKLWILSPVIGEVKMTGGCHPCIWHAEQLSLWLSGMVVPRWESTAFWHMFCLDGVHLASFVHNWCEILYYPRLIDTGHSGTNTGDLLTLRATYLALCIDSIRQPRQYLAGFVQPLLSHVYCVSCYGLPQGYRHVEHLGIIVLSSSWATGCALLHKSGNQLVLEKSVLGFGLGQAVTHSPVLIVEQ